MGTIDIVILILLILAFLWGFIKGFGKHGVGRFAFLGGCLVGYFGGVPLARVVMSTSFGMDTLTSFYASKLPTTTSFTTVLTTDMTSDATQSLMSTALTELKFPTFFQSMFITRATVLDKTVSSALGSSFAFWTLIGFFVLLFFLLTFFIIKAICSKKDGTTIFGENGKGFLGRIAGSVSKIVIMGIIIFALMLVIVLIDQLTYSKGITNVHDWLTSDLKLNDSSTFSIGRLFYNSAASFMNWITLRLNK
ncbi:MAG: hypothetical protein WCR56_01680 [Bacilli bacterium]|jgi:hypothetical protein